MSNEKKAMGRNNAMRNEEEALSKNKAMSGNN
jgi:hypothetical protein